MEQINVVAGGEKWRIRVTPDYACLDRRWRADPWHTVVDTADLVLLAMAIKEAGFRAVYPDAVDPLCKAIEKAIKPCGGCGGEGHDCG